MLTRRALLPALAGPLVANATPRNIVLVLMDDLGWKDFSCYGGKQVETPNIDALAQQSVQFNRFYAACPVCSPTRASILTGKYPTRTGISDWIPGDKPNAGQAMKMPPNRTELELKHQTIAELLRPRGYATASIGKWHLGGVGFSPLEQGFDANIGGDHLGQPNAYLAPFRMPGLSETEPGRELTSVTTARAAEWLTKQAQAKKPFFLYYPQFAVHTPLGSRAELIAKYKAKGALNPTYAAMIECVDDSIGQLVEVLKAQNVWENTTFVLTSDNGAISNLRGTRISDNAPLRGQKALLYEGGIRVPCLIRDPKQKARKVEEAAGSIDLLPTLLRGAGVGVPKDVDGVDLFSRKKAAAYYWHYPHYHSLGAVPSGAMVDGDWKLIENFESRAFELYNLRRDLGEARNVAASEPERVKAMAARLAEWRKETGALMPTR